MRSSTPVQSAEAIFREIAPAGACLAVASLVGTPASPREARAVRFHAGRLAARLAMSRLGVDEAEVGVGGDGAPVWPSGVIGSISHCDGSAAAMIARRGTFGALGIDFDRHGAALDEVEALIMHADERAARPPGVAQPLWTMLHFSAKESVYKAISAEAGRVIDFQEIRLDMDISGGRFAARARTPDVPAMVHRLAGRLACSASHVFTLACLPTVAAR
jgi:4'-phosphopantetheinyl transferase EntD